MDRQNFGGAKIGGDGLASRLSGEFLSQAGECIPTRIGRGFIALAFSLVQVLSATLAESLAVRPAEGTGGKGEQHLFAHDIFEQKPAFVIIPDLGLFFGDRTFGTISVGAFGAEDEVEVALKSLGDGVEAARAEQFEVTMVPGTQANIFDGLLVAAILDDEVGLAGDGEGTNLFDVGGVVHDADGDGLVEDERFVLEIDGFYQHGSFSIFS